METRTRRGMAVTLACGAALGAAGLLALDAADEPASAQGRFTVTAEQLQINQRISQAAVRRSNESLNLLGPVRPQGSTDEKPVNPFSGVARGSGWPTAAIANGAVTADKLAAPTYRATVDSAGSLARGTATSATRTANPGRYQVVFGRDVSQCTYVVQMGSVDTTIGPSNIGFAAASAASGNVNAVQVVTWAADSALANRDFHLAVFC